MRASTIRQITPTGAIPSGVAFHRDGPRLRAIGLNKTFGEVQALKDVSIDLQGGVVHALVGPNGAGKTTLIRMLLDDLAPDSGTVEFTGVGRTRRRGLAIGGATEVLGLDPALTTRATLEFLRLASGLPRTAAERAMAEFGLARLSSRRVGKLSTGERKRLEIALALLADPDVVIFDEPLNGMDPDAFDWFRQLVRDLKEAGKAILVSSHILSELARIADRLTVIHQGTVRHSGEFDPSAQDLEAIYHQTKEA
ncbi:MAG: ATP-binding cassette domain-containing protein [Bifidobacteriaceae bacterium]|jgi:ABC-2 type transport system ATP-binding protein|nr:ATP-binding cassette domain-containing protein [Bifidobacteriaceae bacterium]